MENGKSRLHQAQEDVEEVKTIMLDNLNKADERSTKLGELEDRADELRQKGEAFSKTAVKVKQKKRWENMKYKVIIAVVVALVILILLVALILNFGSGGSSGDSSVKNTAATSQPITENESG